MKKRFLTALLALILALGCLAPAALAASDAWVKMSTTDGSLHLRKGPGKLYGSAGYVKHGDAIDVYFGETGVDWEGEEWTRIYVERTGKSGYIKTKYISYASVSGGTSSGPSVYVSKNGGSLNVRKGPGKSFGVAGYVQHGQSVTVHANGGEWSQITVTATGVTGYIKTKYIVGQAASTPAPSPAPSSYDAAQLSTRTAGGKVNLRQGPGSNYTSLGKLSRGTLLAVLGQSGNWYNVRLSDGTVGYIYKSYVDFGVSAETTARLNLRKGAGSGYGLITTLNKGADVTVHSVTGNWAKVTAAGREGYVSMNFLSLGK